MCPHLCIWLIERRLAVFGAGCGCGSLEDGRLPLHKRRSDDALILRGCVNASRLCITNPLQLRHLAGGCGPAGESVDYRSSSEVSTTLARFGSRWKATYSGAQTHAPLDITPRLQHLSEPAY